MQPLDILQFEFPRSVLYEADFLAVGVYESKAPPGIDHRQRQARESRAGAHISHGRSEQIGMNGEAVEQMMSQHRIAIADRCQVVGAVPALELIEQAREALGIRLGERDTERCRALNGAFDYAAQEASLRGYRTISG